MVFARFRFKKMLDFQAKHNFFICPNERVRRQTHRKQFFMAFSESFLGRKLQERGKITIIFLDNSVEKCCKTLLQFTVNYLIRQTALPNDLFMFAEAEK